MVCESFSLSPAPRIYLASASPRRRELLTQIALSHFCLPQHLDESTKAGEQPAAYVERLARAKAEAGWADPARSLHLPVLAADTTVVCDGEILGKPGSLEEARTMLRRLSGRSHEVLTGIAVTLDAQTHAKVVSTAVSFRELRPDEIDAYWHSGEPCDKAGGYGIQGRAALFVTGIEGSYSNVVGLPLFETAQLLEVFGITSIALLQAITH